MKNHKAAQEAAGSDILGTTQLPPPLPSGEALSGGRRRVLSLFSGCGGMDIGFEGGFLAPRKAVAEGSGLVACEVNKDWVMVRKTSFTTVFANDILPEAQAAWTGYLSRYGHGEEVYHHGSIVDYVRLHRQGVEVFPQGVDVVTGGFPCQDFSVAGKRMGFDSRKDDRGRRHEEGRPEVSRGMLYQWMRQVIDLTQPKVFVAENVKGLVNLGDAKDIIQRDFASAGGNGYVVMTPQVLCAADYGVPEMRERVIFIGLRRDALLPEALAALTAAEPPEAYNPYPPPTHDSHNKSASLPPPVSVRDVLRGLREPQESVDASQRVYSRARYLGKCQGQTEVCLDGLSPTIRSEHHGNIEYRRLSREHGGRHEEELDAGLQERRLTPRECALIQTFPPDYRFVVPGQVSASAAYKVIGNAVPPLLAFNIATRLERIWPLLFG